MKFDTASPVGIVAYGSALPRTKILAEEIALAQGKVLPDGQPDLSVAKSLGVRSKTAPDLDEDAATLATAAGWQALERWRQVAPAAQTEIEQQIQALFVGSESHPYAVKPTGTVVAQALGLSSDAGGPEHKAKPLALVDLQFACKAATQGLQLAASYVQGGLAPAALAIGADTAQAQPGDVLEYTAGAGATAVAIGQGGPLLAQLLGSVSIATDTPDFWRRPGQEFPQHAGRFTGGPAYFTHLTTATKLMLDELQLQPADIDWCVFHTPNLKFPKQAARQLGFSVEQLAPSLVAEEIGNTYAAAALTALAAVLDQAEAGQKILMTSYGSGAGADSFVFEVTGELPRQRQGWSRLVRDQIDQLQPVNYQTYQDWISTHQH